MGRIVRDGRWLLGVGLGLVLESGSRELTRIGGIILIAFGVIGFVGALFRDTVGNRFDVTAEHCRDIKGAMTVAVADVRAGRNIDTDAEWFKSLTGHVPKLKKAAHDWNQAVSSNSEDRINAGNKIEVMHNDVGLRNHFARTRRCEHCK